MKSIETRSRTVDEYIAAAVPAVRQRLADLRACIREAVPEATEQLKWGHPAYSLRRILVVFAAHQKHVGFHPTPAAIKAFSKQLSGYKTSGSTIQFPHDRPLPLPLIRKITRFRAQELNGQDRKWKS